MLSACLVGTLCGADGSSYGQYPHMVALSQIPTVKVTTFCPEDYSFGTPREIPDIEGGNGHDVLDGKAKVITQTGKDVSEGMVKAAQKMLDLAQTHAIELAILMDISAACGSQVLYKGHRLHQNPTYQAEMGVCAALLQRNGFEIISQRDYRSLEILLSKVKPKHTIDPSALDHHETAWYKSYFSDKS